MTARTVVLAGVVALLASGTAACRPDAGGASLGDRFEPLEVGQPAPAFAVRTLGGDSARVGAGQPATLVNVWATWCIPCQAEFGDLAAIQRDYATRGLRVLAVSVDAGDDGAVRDFVRARGASFVIGRDPEARVRALYSSVGVPESYLVDGQGRLRWRTIGALPAGAAPLRAVLDSVLATAP
jgi:thiol-disulfide isomerase/thioredoxin